MRWRVSAAVNAPKPVRYRYYHSSYSGTRKPKNLISAKSSI
ncbi:Uncharacterised protein [Vibrio cholerae]|nr:Uncharacterised protein [Vibrio cholerae]